MVRITNVRDATNVCFNACVFCTEVQLENKMCSSGWKCLSTCIYTCYSPHALSCRLLDLQCPTLLPQQLFESNREKESKKTLYEKCQFSPWIIISEVFLCSFSLCRKSPNVKLRMSRGARLCQQAWTGLAPLSEIKDIVSDAGLLMNSISQFSDIREQKWLSGGYLSQKGLHWLPHGHLSMPNENKYICCEHNYKHRGSVVSSSVHKGSAVCLRYLGCLHIPWNQGRGCSDNLWKEWKNEYNRYE